jgi:hypothetical protein
VRSEFREVAPLRRDRFLTADIPVSMPFQARGVEPGSGQIRKQEGEGTLPSKEFQRPTTRSHLVLITVTVRVTACTRSCE